MTDRNRTGSLISSQFGSNQDAARWDRDRTKDSPPSFRDQDVVSAKDHERLAETTRWLQESQTLTRTGSFVFDLENSTWYGSENTYALLDVHGSTDRDLRHLTEIIHPDDREPTISAFLNGISSNDAGFDLEFRLARKHDDRSIWLHCVAILRVSERTDHRELVGTVQDITNRKTELLELEQWQTVFEYAGWGVVTAEPESHRIILCNQAFADMHGYTTEELQLLTLHTILPPEEQELLSEQSTVINSEDRHVFESIHIRKDGTQFSVLSDVSGIRSSSGQLLFVAANVQDLTDQKALEVDRRALDHELFRLQKAESLEIMSGGVAHDFNNLLMTIIGNVAMATEDLPPEHPVQELLSPIRTAAHQASELAAKLLSYTGEAETSLQQIVVSDLVEEVVDIIRTTIPTTTELAFHLSEPCFPVIADPIQVRQLLLNLVVNASEAIGSETGRILISSTCEMIEERDYTARCRDRTTVVNATRHHGSFCVLTVEDNGPGVDPSLGHRIFDPFYSTKFTGRGLGLAVVIGVVRSHFGLLQVDSAQERGTIFKIYLPNVMPDAEDGATMGTVVNRAP